MRPFVRCVQNIHWQHLVHHVNGNCCTLAFEIDPFILAELKLGRSVICKRARVEQTEEPNGIDVTAAACPLHHIDGTTDCKRMAQPQASVEKSKKNERNHGPSGCTTTTKPTRTITVSLDGYGSTTVQTVVGLVTGWLGRLWDPQRFGDGASEERKRTFARRNRAKDGVGGAESTSFTMDEAPVVERCEKRSWKGIRTTVESQLT